MTPRPEPLRDAEGRVEGARHGTYLGYSSDGCRCGECREAKSQDARARRAAKAAVPGPEARDAQLAAWSSGYSRGRRDAMALVLSAAEVQAPAFARQLRSLAQQMEVQR